jgi:hypothetical protein
MFLRGRDGEVRIGSGEGCANWPSTKARLKFVGASFTWNMGAADQPSSGQHRPSHRSG